MVFLPDAMMITIIAPIIKNKAHNLSDNNYRPIALATIASKLFESLILSRVSHFSVNLLPSQMVLNMMKSFLLIFLTCTRIT